MVGSEGDTAEETKLGPADGGTCVEQAVTGRAFILQTPVTYPAKPPLPESTPHLLPDAKTHRNIDTHTWLYL